MDIIGTLKRNSGVVLGASTGVFVAPLLLGKARSLVDLGQYTDLVWSVGIAALSIGLFKSKPAAASAFAGVFLAHGIAAVVPQLTA